VTITRVQMTIRVPPPDRPAARPRRTNQPPGPRQPCPDSRRDQVTRIMASQPGQDWSGSELAGRLGVDDAKLAEAIEGGPLDAPIADAKLHKMERGDFAPEFPLEWALKDVDLAIAAAGDDELPLLAALSRQWRAAVDAGHGREDISAARLALGGHQQP